MSGSSLESDLRAAREAKGLSLPDIQAETRIPVHILQQFEDGRLVGDPTYNHVYLKAFLKSYAKSVGVPQADVLAAYESRRGGRPSAPVAPAKPETAAAVPPVDPAPAPPVAPPPPPAEPAPDRVAPSPPVSTASAPETAVAASAGTARPTASASTAGTRVRKPPVPTARRSFDKNWGTIIGLFLVVVAVLAGAVWFLAFRGGDDAAEETPFEATNETAAAIDSAGVGAGSATQAPQLQSPIRVVVYAGGNGLQNFRVTEAPNERLGHWVEPGDSKTFESAQAVTLWGEGGDGFGDDAVVEIQGQRWIPTGAVPLRIDATTGQQLLDSLSSRPPGTVPAIPGAVSPTGE